MLILPGERATRLDLIKRLTGSIDGDRSISLLPIAIGLPPGSILDIMSLPHARLGLCAFDICLSIK